MTSRFKFLTVLAIAGCMVMLASPMLGAMALFGVTAVVVWTSAHRQRVATPTRRVEATPE